jgi:hypothetical protein
MLDYAVETAFRADTRRVPNGRQLMLALNLALNVGESMFWQGFTHGKHRPVELTHPVPLPVNPTPAEERKKKPKEPGAKKYVRPPR